MSGHLLLTSVGITISKSRSLLAGILSFVGCSDWNFGSCDGYVGVCFASCLFRAHIPWISMVFVIGMSSYLGYVRCGSVS